MTPEPSAHVSVLLVDPSRGDDTVPSLRGRFDVVEAATAVAALSRSNWSAQARS